MMRQFGGFKVRLTALPYKLSYLPQNLDTDGKETCSRHGQSHGEPSGEGECKHSFYAGRQGLLAALPGSQVYQLNKNAQWTQIMRKK